jgi:transcriptional regulator with XRE-family HTH domain
MSESDFSVFRERLIKACKMRETTPDRVARIIGMAARRVIDIEYAGLKGLDIHRLAQIADKLDVSVDWLLGRTDNSEINDRRPPRGKP